MHNESHQKKEHTIRSSFDPFSDASQCRNIKELLITNRRKIIIAVELYKMIG